MAGPTTLEVHPQVLINAATGIAGVAEDMNADGDAYKSSVAGLSGAYGTDGKGRQAAEQFAQIDTTIMTLIGAFVADLGGTSVGLETMAWNVAAADSASTVEVWETMPALPLIPKAGPFTPKPDL